MQDAIKATNLSLQRHGMPTATGSFTTPIFSYFRAHALPYHKVSPLLTDYSLTIAVFVTNLT
jgi:hypothetical protein